MGMSDVEKRKLKGNALSAFITAARAHHDLLAIRIPEAVRISGLSRSEIYRRAGLGQIVLLKCGRSTLVDVPSLRMVVASLPRVTVRASEMENTSMPGAGATGPELSAKRPG